MEIIYRHFETLPSTNDWAKEHLHLIPNSGLLVVTSDCQTAGKGQQGKRWISPPAVNLYVTYAFKAEEADPLLLTRHLATSTAQVLQTHGVNCTIKWPNDLLVNRKKIAGILCETIPPDAVIIGMGLNVNMPPEALALIDQPATSLLAETGHPHELPPLLETLSLAFASSLSG